MKNTTLSLMVFASLTLTSGTADAGASNFTPAQVEEIKQIVGEHILSNTGLVMTAVQTEMEKKQKEDLAQIERKLAQHKDKIFKEKSLPTAGNLKGSLSLVVFMEPYCGYCRKFHKEVISLINMNKNLKVIFVDLPLMGEKSALAVKALAAAQAQGKYASFQRLMFESKGILTYKKLLKQAKSVGLDVKKFEADLKSKEMRAFVENNSAIAEVMGITATPFLILNEKTVFPGYIPALELNKLLLSPAPKNNVKT